MNNTPVILACVRSASDRAEIVRGAKSLALVRFCRTTHELVAELAAASPMGVILELSGDGSTDISPVVDAMSRRSLPFPLVLRLDLKVGAVLQAVSLEDRVFDLRISVRRADAIADCVSHLSAQAGQQAGRMAIASCVVSRVPPTVLDLVMGAVVLGSRHVRAESLARLCQLSPRRMEERLAKDGVMPAKHLLMWMLCLHSLFRADRLALNPKQVATLAGLPSVDALSKHTLRLLKVRFPKLVSAISFETLLEMFGKTLLRQEPAPAVTGGRQGVRL